MSVVTAPAPEQRFVWYQLSWDQYEALLRALGDRRLRHTYVEGALEIVSPSMDHESSKSVIGDFVVTLCRVLRLPRKSIGSTTMKKMKWRRGLEPDEGFYVGEESVRHMRSRRDYDPDRAVAMTASSFTADSEFRKSGDSPTTLSTSTVSCKTADTAKSNEAGSFPFSHPMT